MSRRRPERVPQPGARSSGRTLDNSRNSPEWRLAQAIDTRVCIRALPTRSRFMGSLHIQRCDAPGDHERSTFNAQRSTNVES